MLRIRGIFAENLPRDLLSSNISPARMRDHMHGHQDEYHIPNVYTFYTFLSTLPYLLFQRNPSHHIRLVNRNVPIHVESNTCSTSIDHLFRIDQWCWRRHRWIPRWTLNSKQHKTLKYQTLVNNLLNYLREYLSFARTNHGMAAPISIILSADTGIEKKSNSFGKNLKISWIYGTVSLRLNPSEYGIRSTNVMQKNMKYAENIIDKFDCDSNNRILSTNRRTNFQPYINYENMLQWRNEHSLCQVHNAFSRSWFYWNFFFSTGR